MASKIPSADTMTEQCARCDRETPHEIAVELRTESDEDENSQFSREPYRVSECQTCGDTTTKRMNNA